MKLHKDKDAFTVLLESIHDRTGYREDVLEKDYYVVLILKELAKKQKDGLPAYFKGGTALYKMLKPTRRFSEDIDLSVNVESCTSRTQEERFLANATKNYENLIRKPELGKTNRSEVISVYVYDPVGSFDKDDLLQRFGKLKIEATSFTISDPITTIEVSPMIYDLASNDEKEILKSNYDIYPFNIQTISLERIFIDKLFATESYVRKSDEDHRAFEAAKHIYDLSVMSKEKEIIDLLEDEKTIRRLLDIRTKEEKERLDGIPNIPPIEFTFFTDAKNNKNVIKAYEIMQNQYVLRDEDKVNYTDALKDLKDIKTKLSNNKSWINYIIKD